MKYLQLIGGLALLAFSAFFFTGCSDDEDLSLYSEWENILNNHACDYDFDDQGRCFGDGGGISQANFEKHVFGYGWKHYGTWEIDENGRRLEDEFYRNNVGLSPLDFYFENDTVMTTYERQNAQGNTSSSRHRLYAFHNRYEGTSRSVVLLDNGYYLQITGWTLGSRPSFCAVHPLGIMRNGKEAYGVSIYVRMTDNELEAFRSVVSKNVF